VRGESIEKCIIPKEKEKNIMNTLVLLLICVAVLLCGYIFYGGWLCKQWGVGESKEETPAHTLADGVDYVPAKAPVLMGHHFSSIAGAGPITGPINAALFGWLPVTLWILVGGIFFGGVHDFGALFASIRHKGQSIGEIISVNMSKRAKRLFLIFAYLTLLLVVAAFASIVATTFGATYVDGVLDKAASASNASVAMVSLLFIVIAIVFGFAVYRRNAPMLVSTIVGVVAIILCMAIGMNFHPFYLSTSQWMIVVGIYIAVASVTPVWILLQPRDYLSSFLLYAMLAVAFIGVIGAHPSLSVATEDGGQTFAAFGGFAVDNGNGVQYLFPVLFTTVACGAISGFHSLVSSGTTSKQLDKETDAKPIAYGGMLLECVLAVLTLCAIAYARQTGHTGGATDIFAGGIAEMVAAIPGLSGSYNTMYTLLVLTYSAFCLTSLDTATRLARFMFQEFWLEPGQTVADVKEGYKKILVNPIFATILTVVLGIALGMTGYSKIWGLFGAANQLLAALGLMAVATWLGNVGKNNKMFIIPMTFMLIVTICSLLLTIKNQIGIIAAGGADWGPYAQAILAILLVVLAVILAIEGVQTLSKKKPAKA
jgi:carbon starvation protein